MKSFLRRLQKLEKEAAEEILPLSMKIEFVDAQTMNVTRTLLLESGKQTWTEPEARAVRNESRN